MHPFLMALFGGSLLGLAAVSFLYMNGRIAGISGLLAQCLNVRKGFLQSPAFWFITGLIFSAVLYGMIHPPKIQIDASPWILVAAGLLVGIGTQMGSGCTSGHGICGISRLSLRSMVATLSFMLAGFVTVYLIRHVFFKGGV